MRLVSVILASAVLAVSGVAQGTIRGGVHDFANASWNLTPNGTAGAIKPGQTCGVCHIPHVSGRVAARIGQPLLWGRQMSAVTYTMYTSPTIDGATDTQPTGASRLCLSCHDGSVALDLYHRRTTTVAGEYISGDLRIPGKPATAPGTDFGADHPISIRYNSDPGTGMRPVTAPFAGVVPNQTINDVLEGGKVQCSSCHDVHGTDVPIGAPHLLRIQNNNNASPSALCLACHIK